MKNGSIGDAFPLSRLLPLISPQLPAAILLATKTRYRVGIWGIDSFHARIIVEGELGVGCEVS